MDNLSIPMNFNGFYVITEHYDDPYDYNMIVNLNDYFYQLRKRLSNITTLNSFCLEYE